MTTPARGSLGEETIRRIEQAIGPIATQSVARMDEELAWFRELPADQRSWVTLVAQTGLQSFVDWLRSRDDVLRLTGGVFAAAPAALARMVNLQQTVELVRTTIAVAEQQMPPMAAPGEGATLQEELLRFSREIAFASARVYALAAESRGAWDERLEALVIDNLIRGYEVGDPLPSQLAALGWRNSAAVAAVVGSAPETSAHEAAVLIRRATRRMRLDSMSGVHGNRLVVVLGGNSPEAAAPDLVPIFGPGPIVLSSADDVTQASHVTRAALSGLRAAAAWPAAPRPVAADALLPERALSGDLDARQQLVEHVYLPLRRADPALLETVTAFLDAGTALEPAARALFVHANTVRYRLRRATEITGEAATEPRGAFTLRIALIYGRLAPGS